MGTHCHLGVRLPDGRVEATYVHYDGYPRNMLPSIDEFLSKRTTSCLLMEIRKAQSCGGFRCFTPDNREIREDPYYTERITESDLGEGVYYTYVVNFDSQEIEAAQSVDGRWVKVNPTNL